MKRIAMLTTALCLLGACSEDAWTIIRIDRDDPYLDLDTLRVQVVASDTSDHGGNCGDVERDFDVSGDSWPIDVVFVDSSDFWHFIGIRVTGYIGSDAVITTDRVFTVDYPANQIHNLHLNIACYTDPPTVCGENWVCSGGNCDSQQSLEAFGMLDPENLSDFGSCDSDISD